LGGGKEDRKLRGEKLKKSRLARPYKNLQSSPLRIKVRAFSARTTMNTLARELAQCGEASGGSREQKGSGGCIWNFGLGRREGAAAHGQEKGQNHGHLDQCLSHKVNF